jgi:hypothetical protein
MLVVYEPHGGTPEEFPFKSDELMSFDAEAIEDVGGPTWDSYAAFIDKLMNDNFKARRALLWVMLRRKNPKLRFADLVVQVDELHMAFDADELRDILARDDLPPAQRVALEAELAERDPQPVDPEPVGKDELDGSATGSPSAPPDSEPSPSN